MIKIFDGYLKKLLFFPTIIAKLYILRVLVRINFFFYETLDT